MRVYKIPEASVMRLVVYSRLLGQLMAEGVDTVSSRDIARCAGVSSAQVRKDLAYFGAFGTRGVGYQVERLYDSLREILGQDKQRRIMIVGVGRLGWALACYPGFYNKGYTVKAAVDVNPMLIGKAAGPVVVADIKRMEELIAAQEIEMALITVPAAAAQEVADRLVAAGSRAILNFAPCVIRVPHGVQLRNVDLTVNMEMLSFNLLQNS
ncbi:MAG: redox-sensing transcriptional repressor Rex [Syntrophomonadaceae bacterium]|nr:redox-sensing transcriptional repressor Rex [Syntrophomonadaceae bacterium]